MLLLAIGSAGEILSIVLGVLGVAGIIFTALKFNRDDTTAIVTQQGELYGEMKMLNDEVRQSRDECLERVKKYES